jgi:hypothetical protein
MFFGQFFKEKKVNNGSGETPDNECFELPTLVETSNAVADMHIPIEYEFRQQYRSPNSWSVHPAEISTRYIICV